MHSKRSLPLAIGMAAAALSFNANAGLISVGTSYSSVVIVDAGGATRNLSVTTGGTITDVDVFVDFTKCDLPILSDGTCSGPDFSFNGELGLTLTSAAGTAVDLVYNGSNGGPDTYSGSTPGARVGVLFDDEAATSVGGSLLSSGTFRPEEMLSAIDGEDALGSWSMTIVDNAGDDPASLNGWRLDITTADVPEPGVASLMVLGLAGLGYARNRRRGA